MNANKFKTSLVITCCSVAALCSEIRCMESASDVQATTSQPSLSYFSSFRNLVGTTSSKVHELALNGCDRFGKWIVSYAKDIPPAYFAKSFLEIDYRHDALFWQGCFYQEIEDLQKVHTPNKEHLKQLAEMQYIVFLGFLSPYAYEKELKALEEQWKSLNNHSYSPFTKKILKNFHADLLKEPSATVKYFKKDLLNFLQGIQNDDDSFDILWTNKGNGEFIEVLSGNDQLFNDFEEMLAYYRGVMNDFDYGEVLASLSIGMNENKGNLSLSEIQYKGLQKLLIKALHKVNKKQYFKIKEERSSNQLVQDDEHAKEACASSEISEENNDKPTSFLSSSLFFANVVKQGISFSLRNPVQAVAMGLAFQTAAVAAISPFTADELGLKMEEDVFNKAIEFEETFMKALEFYQQNKSPTLVMSQNKDITVVIGRTGVGKSTLLNVITNQRLKVTFKGYELENPNIPGVFKIGTGLYSETLLPKVGIANDLVFSDLPGFEDNRGESTAIVNAMFIRDILTSANSVRFLFLEGEDAITGGKGEGLKKSLIVLQDLLPDRSDIVGSGLLVITRSNYPSQEDLLNFLKEKLDQEEGPTPLGAESCSPGQKKASAYSILNWMFSLEGEQPRALSFENSARFKKTVKKVSILDDEGAQESMQNTREVVLEGIAALRPARISEINMFALLAPGMDVKVSQLLKIIRAKHFLPLFKGANKINDLKDDELNNLIQENDIEKKDRLKEQFMLRPEIDFIKSFCSFDERFCTVDTVAKNVDEDSKELVEKINNTIKARHDKAEEKRQAEIKKQQLEFRDTDVYRGMCLKIDNLFSDLEQAKKAWEGFDASFSNWDYFTLGYFYDLRCTEKTNRKTTYDSVLSNLKNALKEYHDHSLIQKKHRRHDEI